MEKETPEEVQLRRGIMDRLKHALQLLAMSSEIQLSLLPDFVAKADELALDFDHWCETAIDLYSPEITEEQIRALKRVDKSLSDISWGGSAYHEKLWTDEAVRDAPEWEEVRLLAKEALAAFRWDVEIPPSYAHEYVGSEDPSSKGTASAKKPAS